MSLLSHSTPSARLVAIAVAALAGVLATDRARAQDAADLATVVVTASGSAQQVKDAPASITVVTGEELRRRSFRDLTDALRDVEGVAVTGTANESEISIRGMPGDYTLILVDGKRQSTRARKQQQRDVAGHAQGASPGRFCHSESV